MVIIQKIQQCQATGTDIFMTCDGSLNTTASGVCSGLIHPQADRYTYDNSVLLPNDVAKHQAEKPGCAGSQNDFSNLN